MVELTIRVIFSLAVVLGLLMLCARVAGRRFQGRGDALVQVVHRQALGRHASVSVVNVSGRFLVLGTTEQEVRLLTELDPELLEGDAVALEETDTVLTLVPEDRSSGIDLFPLAEPRRETTVEAVAQPGRHAAPRRVVRASAGAPSGGRADALGGSVLSPRTWQQAWGAVTGQGT
ncbi:flagellar biosynthetic protein FliO [Nocardioides sp.]|uniref:FliO/MopB family protein n=1 Tax=Nocardioides sp. TaxID=35761 RepID=UPI001A30FE5E|nr:flagellar biosynthetic protein FliO [Nocardioides sp.]MBJ7358605.1 FliO/MopB family protein [Nocardioides sp.]